MIRVEPVSTRDADERARPLFAAALTSCDDLQAQADAMHAEYEAVRVRAAEKREAAQKLRGANKARALRAAEDEATQAYEALRPRADALHEQIVAKRKERDAKLRDLAQAITPVPGTRWVHVQTVDSSSYRSQGWGANRYAEGSAKLTALEFVPWGIETEVRSVPWREKHKDDSFLRNSDIIDYEVWAKCEPLDVEVVKRRPLTIREQVKACWKIGINPRVLNPYLPTGYEDLVGLDYHGNNKPGWSDEGVYTPPPPPVKVEPHIEIRTNEHGGQYIAIVCNASDVEGYDDTFTGVDNQPKRVPVYYVLATAMDPALDTVIADTEKYGPLLGCRPAVEVSGKSARGIAYNQWERLRRAAGWEE